MPVPVLIGLTAALMGVAAVLPVAASAPEVLASQTVTQVARTPGGAPAGQISVTAQLVRVDSSVQSRVSLRSSLKGPAVANGTLVVTDRRRAELARSNPRQLATLRPGQDAQLVSPLTNGDASCTQVQVNVWSGPSAPGADAAGRQGPDLQPTFFSVNVCRS